METMGIPTALLKRVWVAVCLLASSANAADPIEAEQIPLEPYDLPRDTFAVGTGALLPHYLVCPSTRTVYFDERFDGPDAAVRLTGVPGYAAHLFDGQLVIAYAGTGKLIRLLPPRNGRKEITASPMAEFAAPVTGLAEMDGYMAVSLGGPSPKIVAVNRLGDVAFEWHEDVEPGSLKSFFNDSRAYFRSGNRVVALKPGERFTTPELAPDQIGEPVAMTRGGSHLLLSSGRYFQVSHPGIHAGAGELAPFGTGTAGGIRYGHLVPNYRAFAVYPLADGTTRIEWRNLFDGGLLGVSGHAGTAIGGWAYHKTLTVVVLKDGKPSYLDFSSIPSRTFVHEPDSHLPNTVSLDPVEVTVPDAGAATELSVPVSLLRGDGANEPLEFFAALGGQSRDGLVTDIRYNAANQSFDVEVNPLFVGSSTLAFGLPLGDQTALVDLTIESPSPNPPEVETLSAPSLNRQTGLFEQRLRVTNTSGRVMPECQLTFRGLPAGTEIYNRSGAAPSGEPTLHYGFPLGGGMSAELLIEYLTTDRVAPIAASIVSSVSLDRPRVSLRAEFEIDRIERLADGSMLIEFPAEPGDQYVVSYHDGLEWRSSGLAMRSGGNRVQWIDNGAPKTASHPATSPSRTYRVYRARTYD